MLSYTSSGTTAVYTRELGAHWALLIVCATSLACAACGPHRAQHQRDDICYVAMRDVAAETGDADAQWATLLGARAQCRGMAYDKLAEGRAAALVEVDRRIEARCAADRRQLDNDIETGRQDAVQARMVRYRDRCPDGPPVVKAWETRLQEFADAEQRRRYPPLPAISNDVLRSRQHAFFAKCEAFYRALPVLEVGPFEISAEPAIIRRCNLTTAELGLALTNPKTRVFMCRSCDMMGMDRAPNACLVASELQCPEGPAEKARRRAVQDMRVY